MPDGIEIIAEIGVNHNGDLHTALELIYEAAKAGCDTVKFQLWDTERVYPRERWDEMKALELSIKSLRRCKEQCDIADIKFLCTPDTLFDAIQLRDHLGVERIKIGSSNVTNLRMLHGVASLGMSVILSSGACTSDELDAAVDCFEKVPLTLLHCVSAYPAPFEQLNLSLVRRYTRRLNVGFSDHTIGYEAALIALAMGARTFEKHLTLDRSQSGPDHAASSDPAEMYAYVATLRGYAKAIGDGEKRIMPCEQENRREYERFVRAQYEDRTKA